MILTEPGSVFVLKAKRRDESYCLKRIEAWLREGLRMPGWAREALGVSHRTNPYRADVGYGEIAVNLDCHTNTPPMPLDGQQST